MMSRIVRYFLVFFLRLGSYLAFFPFDTAQVTLEHAYEEEQAQITALEKRVEEERRLLEEEEAALLEFEEASRKMEEGQRGEMDRRVS